MKSVDSTHKKKSFEHISYSWWCMTDEVLLVVISVGATFVGYLEAGTTYNYHCSVELAGEKNIGISGPVTWSEVIGYLPLLIITSCAVNCSLPSIVGGVAVQDSSHNLLLPLGTTVHVYCYYIGYVVYGPSNITCGEQGWDNIPSCKSKYQSLHTSHLPSILPLTVSPTVISPSPPLVLFGGSYGDDVLLSCDVDGVGVVASQHLVLDNGSLVFSNVSASDEGSYICRVNNSVGELEITVELVNAGNIHAHVHC